MIVFLRTRRPYKQNFEQLPHSVFKDGLNQTLVACSENLKGSFLTFYSFLTV